MIDFIVENYQFIALVGAGLIDVILFVVALFRKKVNPSLDKVLAEVPSWVVYAEKKFGAGHGDDKKSYVIEGLCNVYERLTGVCISDTSSIYKLISKKIEEVLETPQKKGK